MIKKNTKIVLEDDEGEEKKEWMGGIPLSIGEVIHIHSKENEGVMDYKVSNKTVDCYIDGEDQNVEIVYVLKKVE